ncbi:MAG: META domain-containing protein [Chitinophagales bacterium]
MKSIKAVLFVLAVMGLFSTGLACKRHKKKNNKHQTEHIQTDMKSTLNKKWILTDMEGVEGKISGMSGDVFMQIDTKTNQLNGKAPCNSYFGSFDSNYTSTFKVGNVGSTKMYCEPEMKNEDLFFAHLNKVDAFKIVDGKLQLLVGNQVVLKFK